MKTVNQFETAINEMKKDGKLSETFQILQYSEERVIGVDDNNAILWDQNGTAWVYRKNSATMKCVIWNEDTDTPEIKDALLSVETIPELKIN